MTLSFDGSMRSWLKYIGRALQLLTSVQLLPLSSERKTPPRAASSAGGVWLAGCSPPRPRAKPLVGPPLLHQSNPPRPPPAAGGAAGAACGLAGCPARPAGTAAAPGGVASVAALGSAPRAGSGAPASPASICA